MIEDLIPQLDRFKQNIATTSTDGDPEEAKRREGLARYVHRPMIAPNALNGHRSTFKTIEAWSEKLLAKSGVARMVDKDEDSKVVARLVERLRRAMVCYQVSED